SFRKKSGSLSNSNSRNCWADIGVPERRHHHVLNGPSLAVSQFHFNPLPPGVFASPFAHSIRKRVHRRWKWLWIRLWSGRLSVPFRIAEVVVRLHEIVDRKVVLSVIEPGSPSNDLLELNHRIDRTHEDD